MDVATRTRRQPPRLTEERRERTVRRLRRLAWLLERSVRVPGTQLRVGLDGLIGLLPGVGDLVGAAFAVYLLVTARRLGVSRGVQARMLGNVLVDTIVGSIPIVGDVFDFAFKANERNLRLLGITPADDLEGARADLRRRPRGETPPTGRFRVLSGGRPRLRTQQR